MFLNVGVTPLLLMIITLISAIRNLILDKDARLNHNCNHLGGDVNPSSVGLFKIFIWCTGLSGGIRNLHLQRGVRIFSCGAGVKPRRPH